MSDDCNPHGIERPSFLLRALDELDAARQRHPSRGKGLRPRTRRGEPPQHSFAYNDEDCPHCDEHNAKIIPLFPEK